MARKKAQTYEQHKAAERSKRKRAADAAIRAPSMAAITSALGHAVRAAIAAERASEDHRKMRTPLSPHWQAIINDAQERLRQTGFVISAVTASRLESATSPDAHITPS